VTTAATGPLITPLLRFHSRYSGMPSDRDLTRYPLTFGVSWCILGLLLGLTRVPRGLTETTLSAVPLLGRRSPGRAFRLDARRQPSRGRQW
jgi:hypothetical protein